MQGVREAERQIRGCILLIPSELFKAAEREAERQALSLEAYLLALLERRVRQAREAEWTGQGG